MLAFEDLHWADDAMLDFIDELIEWASAIPLLVLCTARPEFLATRPGWGGGKPNALTLTLSPLSEEETSLLVDSLLGAARLPAETRDALLDRASGNPLYAEEFVRLRLERADLWEGDAALPESVQGIIAARLDALDPAAKQMLQDAAVVGKGFWAGALAAIAGLEPRDVEAHLHALERNEFIRGGRRSSVADDREYAFRHILIRDVAYRQIPRVERAEKHLRTAEWIQGLGRPDDHAEMLAHHYLTALELKRAAAVLDPTLEKEARSALRAAGDRATGLAAYAAATRFYAAALELCPDDDPERPQLLLRTGQALRSTEGGGLELLLQALEGFRELGDDEGAATAASEAGQLVWLQGSRDEAYRYANQAVELVSGRPSSPAKAKALLTRAGLHLVTAEFPQALQLARDALPSIDELGLEERRPRALNLIGWSRVGSGDREGLRDLEQALELGLEPPYEHLNSCFENLRSAQYALGELADASATLKRHIEYTDRLGIEWRRWIQVLRAGDEFQCGHWTEAIELADAFLGEVDAGSPHYLEAPCCAVRSAIRLARADAAGASRDAERGLEVGRRAKDGQALAHGLGMQAIMAMEQGRRDEAEALASELAGLEVAPVYPLTFGWPTFANIAWLLHDLDRGDDLVRTLDAIPLDSPWVAAGRAIADGDHTRAADILGEMGHRSAEAEGRLRAAEALVQAGLGAEAEAQLTRALDFYRAVDAQAYIRRAEELKSHPTAGSTRR